MNTRLLMMSSAVVLDLAGVGATFAPHEILAAAGIAAVHPLPVMLQLMGALYIGFAMANWTARANMMGGIHSCLLSLSNCIHFVAGALALVPINAALSCNCVSHRKRVTGHGCPTFCLRIASKEPAIAGVLSRKCPQSRAGAHCWRVNSLVFG